MHSCNHDEIDFGVPTEVASGLFLFKMPMPFRLDHINLYLLDLGESWALIDTGLNHEKTQAKWESTLKEYFQQKPISKIILTHLHPDHIGMSSWLQQRLDLDVWISAPDWEMVENLWQYDNAKGMEDATEHFSKFGVDEQLLDDLVKSRAGYKKLVKSIPREPKFIHPGDTIQSSSGEWEFLPGSGHSPQHMCLWNSQSRCLVSGDHILPTISPNISVLTYGLKNPLQNYLDSLKAFAELDCEFYFPAHGAPSDNYKARISAILEHHNIQCDILLKETNLTVHKAADILFTRTLPLQQRMFALGEAAAHLVYLQNLGKLDCEYSDVWVFTPSEDRVEETVV